MLAESNTLRRWGVIVGVWTGIGLFFAVQVYLDNQYAGRPIGFGSAIFLGLADWYLWALFSPLIVWVARRAPFDREAWLRSGAIHLPFTLLLTLVKTATEQLFLRATAPDLVRPSSMARLNGSLLTCWLIVVVSHALIHYRTSQKRKQRALALENELSRAQLQLLKIQLQPHFLFNTLHSISTLMHRDVDAAEEMLAQLSDLLRMTLENGERQWVRLHEELDFVRLYLKIQKTRFRERLRVVVQVDPSALDARVPNMILQPLVENAVAHGVARCAEGGTIGIRGCLQGDRLSLEITDDGPGPGSDPPQEGIGLRNTRTRLAQLYGEDHVIRLKAPRDGGMQVKLLLPSLPGDQE